MPTDFEEHYDHWREEVADYTTDELHDEQDRLVPPGLTIEEHAKRDAIIAELDARQ